MDNGTNLFWGEGRKADYGLRLSWRIGNHNCSTAKGTAYYYCSINGECLQSPSEKGHVCRCLPGYEGNGYLNGTDCTDIDECSNRSLNACVEPSKGGVCHNFAGSYNCSCAKGYTGDGFMCKAESSDAVLPAIAASFLVWWLKKRHLKLLEAKYFQQLQQYIASRVGEKA
ncbi:hypothetical protein SUGI_0459420 [Cryptomeria japonica]|nr:hypothetical protein SUGI_0459420 [Cryptomeria japonica]